MKIKFAFELDFDIGQIIVFPKKQTLASVVSSPVQSRELSLDNFPANKLAVNCSRCNRRIKKHGGYKQYYSSGFYCENCQVDVGQPIRVLFDGSGQTLSG